MTFKIINFLPHCYQSLSQPYMKGQVKYVPVYKKFCRSTCAMCCYMAS